MTLWELPSGLVFLKNVADTISSRRHCVVMLPGGMDISNFATALKRYLYLGGYGTSSRGIVPQGMFFEDWLLQIVRDTTGQDEIDFNRLLEVDLGCSFIIAEAASLATKDTQFALTPLYRLSDNAKRLKDRKIEPAWTVVVILPPLLPLPQSDICLETLCWQGKWGQADLGCVVESSLRDFPPKDESVAWWIYSLCVGLAITDPLLVGELFQSTPLTVPDITALLKGLPVAERARNAEHAAIIYADKELYEIPVLTRSSDFLSGNKEFDLWRQGLLDADRSGHPFIHPAALVVVNRHGSLKRMICRGQQQVILPLVQDVHKYLCSRLAGACGDSWHQNGPKSGWEHIRYEIGPLPAYIKKYLRYCPFPLQDAIAAWRDVRNTVAHNTFLSFEIFTKAMEKLRSA